MKMHMWYWVFIAILLPIGVQAAEYKLVCGSRFSLCRDLEVSLNSFKEPPPMTCGIHFSPEAPNLKLPDWKPLDPTQHAALLEQIVKSKWAAIKGYTRQMINKKWQKYKSELSKNSEVGRIELWRAKFDLDHTGDAEVVVRLMDQSCNPYKDESRYYMPPDPSLSVVKEGAEKLDKNYKRLNHETADAFYYKGRIYLSRWFGGTDYIAGQGIAIGNKGDLDIVNPFIVSDRFGFSKALCRFRFFDEE